MQDFEKLGLFYLGKQYSLEERAVRPELVLYESKDLTTHAVVVGMTGSGKTGLCLTLLEEAAIDGIPAIAIDPKGDVSNLLLTFPELRPADFQPWIDPQEAARRGLKPDEFAAETAETWCQGLETWGQDPARIARLRAAAEFAVYTPGSSSGRPLSILQSFQAPPAAIVDDADAFHERIASTASGLLAILGIDGDPIRSREHILLANLLDHAWREGRDLDMGQLIRQIQSPPFDKIGLIDLETAFPAKDRFGLSMSLNNLLASPGFSAWMEGEPLDIGKLLYTPEGRPRLSILSIAHLSDAQRMFFVTILLNQVIAWMRVQSGTASLRALLYMDEVFGYFPPVANPPSKLPMLTLLKQARAFGLGVVLATQNPVDLDYKGLSNAGTWFLGRLQTERDKARVLDGLEGVSAAAGAAFDRARIDSILSSLGQRVFLMNNVHEDQPVVFQTRWALSYLRGPLTRGQIQSLAAAQRAEIPQTDSAAGESKSGLQSEARSRPAGGTYLERPVIPPGVVQVFFPSREKVPSGSSLVYRPALLGVARVHFVQASTGIDAWEGQALLCPVEDRVPDDVWNEAQLLDTAEPELEESASEPARFAPLPAELARVKSYAAWQSGLKDHLYRNHTLKLWKCAALKQVSRPGESQGEFRIRLRQQANETRDLELEKLRKRYAPKLSAFEERMRRAQGRVEKEKAQYKQQTFQTAISIGTSVLGALFGRKVASAANVGRAGTAIRAASRAAREHGDIAAADETVEAVGQQLAALEADLQQEMEKVKSACDIAALVFESVEIKPRKSDISVTKVALAWTPWRVDAEGHAQRMDG